MANSDRTSAGAPSTAHGAGGPGHEHLVEFYETEEFLVDTVSGYLGPGLHGRGSVIIVATAAHLLAFEDRLRAAGTDVDHAIAAERYRAFDAAELLERLIVDGRPDPDRFSEVIGGLVERAGAGGRRVRIYGEMVALLLAAGDTGAAIALENLWNDLAEHHDFGLLCAYPLSAFHDEHSAAAFKRICRDHTTVIPSEGYSLLDGADAKRREVARLQQENALLHAQLEDLRAEHITSGRHRQDDELRVLAMQTIAEGVIALDDGGRLMWMNAAAEGMLGWTGEELRGHHVEDLVRSRQAGGAALSFEERRVVRSRVDSFLRRDGRTLPVVYSATPAPGGGVVIAFSDGTEEVAQRRRSEHRLDDASWVGRVRKALAEDRLELRSQPILPLRGGAAREELLLRMVSSAGELIPAGAFLPAVEGVGLIVEIDGWVIGQAVRFAALGRTVQVNLSAASIADRGVLDLIARELSAVRAPAANVIFEVSEAALLADAAAGRAFAAGLGELGCGLVLDDFGTGTGGFAYLGHLEIQAVKIDVDFVRGLPDNPANQHLVQAIVELARGFGLQTIAGGVEDMATLELLRAYDLDYAQGYAINGLSTVAQRVVPPATIETRPRVVGDRARLLRGRLLDHREAQRASGAVAGPA